MRVLFVAGVIAATLWPGAPAHAQSDPAKPVRVLVGFAPGGGIDLVARMYAQRLADALGQSFIVDRRSSSVARISERWTSSSPSRRSWASRSLPAIRLRCGK